MRLLDAEAIATALTPSVAADLLESELHAGLDPEADPPRSVLPAAAGELLVMPSTAGAVGVKLATVAPANPARGLPRIQGAYVLFDPGTLAPVAVLDAAALTAVRTAAVSALAVRFLAAHDASRLLVWGTGPQAWAHVEAVAAELFAAAQAHGLLGHEAKSVSSGSRSPRTISRSPSTQAMPRASARTRACGLIACAASTPAHSRIAGSRRMRSR